MCCTITCFTDVALYIRIRIQPVSLWQVILSIHLGVAHHIAGHGRSRGLTCFGELKGVPPTIGVSPLDLFRPSGILARPEGPKFDPTGPI